MNKILKIVEYGLHLLVFLLPWQTRYILHAGETEYGTLSLYAVDILLIVLLVLVAIFKITNSKFQFPNKIQNSKGDEQNLEEQKMDNKLLNNPNIQNTKYCIQIHWWIIAGLEFFVFISIFAALDKGLAVYKYGVFLLGIGLFWLMTEANFNRIRLIYSLLVGIFVQACLGIWQFLTQSSFACKWLGMAVHDPMVPGTTVVETLSGARWLRAYGGMDHPNILGGLLVIGILLVIFLLLDVNKNNKFLNSKLFFLTSYILLFIFAISLFFTFSRAAWIGLAVGIFVWQFILVTKRDWFRQKALLMVVVLLSLISFVLYINYDELVATRLSQDSRLEIKSSTERIDSYKIAEQVIRDNFWLGTGVGNYTLTVREEVAPGQPAWYYQPVHNVFLLVLSEIGIFGFLLLVMLIGNILIFNFQHFKITNIAILSSVLLIMMFDHWWWSLHFGILFFGFLLGWLLGNNQSDNRINKSQSTS